MSKEAFHRLAHELVASVVEAAQKKAVSLPGFILLYSSIDILASLTRPVNQPSTEGKYFKAWVKEYVIAGSKFVWNENDLWGARCGLLHTSTIQSDQSRSAKAREVHYVSSADPNVLPFVQQKIDPNAAAAVFVDPLQLLEAFAKGVGRFSDAVERNPQLQAVVFAHTAKLAMYSKIEITGS